jgi:hypothetical protein
MEAICEILTMMYNDTLSEEEYCEKTQMLEAYCERITGFKGSIEQLEHSGPTMAFIEYYQHEKIAGKYTGEYSHTSSLSFSKKKGFSVMEFSGNLEEAKARCAEVNAELMG